ncbi:MAG: hypothetical protein RIS44_2355 [Pseudomonadota bacterium]|jgi:hypothetical protein
MPTLVTALTLVSLVKLSHLGYKPWELSFCLALILGVVLWGSLSWPHWLFNVSGMFGACAAWLTGLQATDHMGGQALHWLLLIGGFCALVGARLFLDVVFYGNAL